MEKKRGRSPQKRKKRRRRGAGREAVMMGILLVAVCVFVFSAYQLAIMLVPYYSGGKEYDKVKALAIMNDTKDDSFPIDFDALLAENADTVGWIQFDEPAVINYPVVKSADNTEYLTKTFTANDNKLGAIFMDMRNNPEFTDRNTFVYGHNLKMGGEMFSQLNEYADESFCKEHPYFYIYTPKGEKLTYQVFSAGVVGAAADNYKLAYGTEDEYTEYLKLCQESSNYQVDVELNTQSKIVSLSTCTNVNDEERFLVQGVLIDREQKKKE